MNLDLRKITALYINLLQDTGRNNDMKKLFKTCGFESHYRIDAEYTPNSLAGCSLSHYNALNEVEPPFILFEDDCIVKNFKPIIEIPDDADAVYLGISSWGRMNSHSGPFVQYEDLGNGLLRIYNMLSAHAILYLNQEYVSLCSRISEQATSIADHQDIGFAEIQRYFNVYAFDDPMFYQSSSNGTDQPLTTYPTHELIQPNIPFWKPTSVY
tara:strand:+ start:286 stop:921 length:636 start_codon:yes stop_codon:yes gene_type:complete